MKETVKILAETNDRTYNILKMIEECGELATVLAQSLTKGAKEKDMIDELGDVVFRAKILSHLFGKDKVNKRVEYKLNKCDQYLTEGKYKGGV